MSGLNGQTGVRWQPDVLAVLGSLLWELRSEGIETLDICEAVLVDALRSAESLGLTAARHKAVAPVQHAVSRLLPESDLAIDMVRSARRNALRSMQAAVKTAELFTALEQAGCRPIALKGVVLSELTTNTVDMRGPGDVDLMVAPRDMRKAGAVIQDLGYQPEPGPSLALHADTFRGNGWSVDLHRRLARYPVFAMEDHEVLWARGRWLELGGTTVRTLDLVDTAAYMALSSGMDAWSQLVRVGDQVRLFHQVEQTSQWPLLEERATQWRMAPTLRLARAVVRRVVPSHPRQDPLSESLARVSWKLLASDRQIRLEQDWRAMYGLQFYKIMAAPDPRHLMWWSARHVSALPRRTRRGISGFGQGVRPQD